MIKVSRVMQQIQGNKELHIERTVKNSIRITLTNWLDNDACILKETPIVQEKNQQSKLTETGSNLCSCWSQQKDLVVLKTNKQIKTLCRVSQCCPKFAVGVKQSQRGSMGWICSNKPEGELEQIRFSQATYLCTRTKPNTL